MDVFLQCLGAVLVRSGKITKDFVLFRVDSYLFRSCRLSVTTRFFSCRTSKKARSSVKAARRGALILPTISLGMSVLPLDQFSKI